MATVGEMVGERFGVVDWNDRPAGRIVDLEWRTVLRSLGIWNAEVVEGKFRVGLCDYLEVDGEVCLFEDLLGHPDDGARFHLIVLPSLRGGDA